MITNRELFTAWSKQESFVRKVSNALAVLRRARANDTRPYIAFSGGKDSTVMLDIVRQVFPDAPAVLSDDEWHLPETLEYIATIPNLHRVAGRRTHADWFTAWEQHDKLPESVAWIEAMEFGSRMGTWARGRGCNAACIGIREDESVKRRVHVRHSGQLFYAKSRQMWHVYPIAKFTLIDIWAYIVSRELPYNHAYDRLAQIGVELKAQRVGPMAVDAVLGYGQMAILKKGWPDLFNRFASAHPEARLYA